MRRVLVAAFFFVRVYGEMTYWYEDGPFGTFRECEDARPKYHNSVSQCYGPIDRLDAEGNAFGMPNKDKAEEGNHVPSGSEHIR